MTEQNIQSGVAELVAESHDNPSNADLLVAVQHQQNIFNDHATDDKNNFDAIHTKMDTIIKGQAETMEFMKNLGIGIGFFKFTFNNAAKIGAFIGLIAGFVLVGKYMLIGFFTAFGPK